MQKFKQFDLSKDEFDQSVLDYISELNLWSLWIPKSHGGLEKSLVEGLATLKQLAQLDGSLGWAVTLCSGANYFMGNLQKDLADALFLDSKEPICFGGSGGVYGTAEQVDEAYLINGTWNYATGAPFLTHFTLNAQLKVNGVLQFNEDGSPKVHSFIIPKEGVEILEDWDTMGLKATVTHSFKVKDQFVSKDWSFLYNKVYHPHSIFKIPFELFADFTLWVNYIGMALHLIEELEQSSISEACYRQFKRTAEEADQLLIQKALQLQNYVEQGVEFTDENINNLHQIAGNSVKSITQSLLESYPNFGIRAARLSDPINRILRDYLTATQHHNFRSFFGT